MELKKIKPCRTVSKKLPEFTGSGSLFLAKGGLRSSRIMNIFRFYSIGAGGEVLIKKNIPMNKEQQRLQEPNWKKWGPYLSERQWGTVREDYSEHGDAWDYFSHDHARSRVYRWGEDGIAGISDDLQRICFSLAMWNGKDPILKERMFGLTGTEGNHGEDVKELY
jgi:hypothetical protein